MEVAADTQVLVNEMSAAAGTGSTSISLKQLVGNTVNRVQKLVDSSSNYEVETPAGTAVVRGTTFRVIVEGDGFTIVISDSGEVWFIANGVAKLLEGGEWSSACVGCPPSDPLPSPTPTPTPTYTLTVTNEGCWGVYVTGLPGGGQEGEWIGGNTTIAFPGIPKDTQVTLDASDGDGWVFTGWYLDSEQSSRPDPLTITMAVDHHAWSYCEWQGY